MKAGKKFQTFLLFVNLIFLFVLPSYFFDINVSFYSWMIVALFAISIFFAIKFSLLHHLYYFTFFLFVYIAIHFIQTATGIRFILGFPNVSPVTPIVFVYFLIHLVAMLVPCFLSSRDTSYRSYHITQRSCFIVALSVIFYTLFVATVIDPSAFFSTREEQYVAGGQGNAVKIIVFIAKIVPFFALILIFQKAFQVRKPGIFYFLFICMLIFAAFVANPINTPRYISLTSISILAIYIISTVGRMRYLAAFVLVSPCFLLLLLPLSSVIRHGISMIGLEKMTLSYTGLEFSSFQVLLDAFNVEAELQSSNYSLSALFIVIPRSIWPNKAEGFGDEIATASGYTFTNTGVTSGFNMFADYGWIGLVIFSLLIGLLMTKGSLYNGMSFRNRSAFYSILFFSQIPMLIRGDFSTYMIAIYSFAISYEGALLVSRIRLIRQGKFMSSLATKALATKNDDP